MKKQGIQYLYLMSALLFGACAKDAPKDFANIDSRGNSGGTTTGTVSVRYCEDKIEGANETRLADFFSVFVSELENYSTFCYEALGFGENIEARLMIEYEDRYGIRAVTFDTQNVVSAKLVNENETSSSCTTGHCNYTRFDAIFRDDFGLVRIRAKGLSNSGVLTGTIWYYNFPDYATALNQAVEQVRQDCQNGVKTVYECLGYTYPTHWWNQPISQSYDDQVKQMAIEIMNGGSSNGTRKTLGTISLDIGVPTFPY
jgi:hypothetical protein